MQDIFEELNTINTDSLIPALLEAEQRWINNPNNPNYWLDFNEAKPNGDGTFTIICKPVKMPYDRVIEMFCDFVGAGKAYNKEKWTCETPWNYWISSCEGKRAMHPASEYLIKKLLWNLKEYGLSYFIEWYTKANDYLQEKYQNGELNY